MGGPLSGLIVSNRYDECLRRTNLSILNSPSSSLFAQNFRYDAAGRLATVASGTNAAAYEYLANSPLVGHIFFTNGSALRMTTTKQYDLLNRLTSIASVRTGSTPSPISSAYQYNLANQRTALTNADNSYWLYTYNTLGQVTSGRKYWANGTPVAGQQFDYAFDDIGNRETTERDGREAEYVVNSLNQYTSRTVPGYVNVLGTAHSNAHVIVNTTVAERHGEYFRAEVPVGNTVEPVWLAVRALAALTNGTPQIVTNAQGHVLVAKTPETFTYDLDGNLTSDSLWTNTWSGENRRVTVESRLGVPPGA